jgi:pyridoxal 5'-phosphate synthase pdxT subunit
MAAPVVGVLALQGDVREHLTALRQVGATAVTVRRVSELDAVDALVLPGGESTTMSRLAVTFGLMQPLRDAVSAGLPVYGTCAGMILLADTVLDGRDDQETIGGIDMTVRRNAFGRQIDSFETDVQLSAVGEPDVHAVFIRAPWVESVGAGVEVLARISDGSGAGTIVAVRRGNLVATSFHPELTGDTRIHRWFVDQVVSP